MHRPSDTMFLGIDHTAIVVGDYRQRFEVLPRRTRNEVAGVSENYGTEQNT